MTVQAVHGGYGYFRFDYLARADFAGSRPVMLRCRETMTLQKNRDAMYLLRYERHVNQLWEPSDDTVSSKGFLFGVQEEGSVQAVSAGNVTAFAVNGDLYAYEAKAHKLTRVFSFRRRSEHELRTLRSDCSIRIMSVNGDSMCQDKRYTQQQQETPFNSFHIALPISVRLLKRRNNTLFWKFFNNFFYWTITKSVEVFDWTELFDCF